MRSLPSSSSRRSLREPLRARRRCMPPARCHATAASNGCVLPGHPPLRLHIELEFGPPWQRRRGSSPWSRSAIAIDNLVDLTSRSARTSYSGACSSSDERISLRENFFARSSRAAPCLWPRAARRKLRCALHAAGPADGRTRLTRAKDGVRTHGLRLAPVTVHIVVADAREHETD